MPTWIGGEIVPIPSYVKRCSGSIGRRDPGERPARGYPDISVPGQTVGNWEFPTDVGYFRLDLPDAGILTVEEDLRGGLPEDPALVMAFGFSNGESSILVELRLQIPHAWGSGTCLPPQSPPQDAGIEAAVRGI